jgi:hypothetical protein
MNEQYFAQINENNFVTNVVVATTEFMEANPDRYPGMWVETFFNLPNKTYAGIGYTYDPVAQDFISPPPPPPREG